ncbi:uncharacterized protein IL334_002469 [Kwoniella shivajii]|uniref:Sox C-terminal domain-containing protein n=1 Tax=Kwoniella shivajii TaxID=564305 RepID=A0ABZ1CWI7_9TREE|nr:hypothetical protein IL334_002469 [Kwoniella shivajii]
MEAIRPNERSHERSEEDGVDILPPPPEPFPLDQIVGSSSKEDGARDIQPKQHIRGYLNSVQQSCINALTSLPPSEPSLPDIPLPNAQLAAALTDLLEVTHELDDLLPPSQNLTPSTVHTTTFSDNSDDQLQTSTDALKNLLEGLQDARNTGEERSGVKDGSEEGLHPAINVVREELAWQRIEHLSMAIFQLSTDRTNTRHATTTDSGNEGNKNGLPPTYQQYLDSPTHQNLDERESDNTSLLPSYQDIQSINGEQEAGPSTPEKKSSEPRQPSSPTSPTASREKMMNDLDSLTTAIERLSSIAPRLQDQRVEMRHAPSKSLKILASGIDHKNAAEGKKLSREEKMRLEKQKMKELEDIWDKIERAHGKRRIRVEEGQRADREGWENRRRERFLNRISDQSEANRLVNQDSTMGSVDAELARARDLRDRDHFLRDLIDQSGERRMDNQDATAFEADLTIRNDKQEELLSEIISHTRASRLSTQDFPLAIEDKLAERRASLMESIMDYSSSGRMHDQDSAPPTPRRGSSGEKEEDPLEMVTVQDFLATAGPNRQRSVGVSGEENILQARSQFNPVSVEVDGKKSSSNSGRTTPTAFKKIAGLMRRGSGHLSLKPTNALDVDAITYMAEHQENLRSVQITLHGIGISPNLDWQISSLTNEQEAIITSKRDSAISFRLPLPVAIESHQTISFTAQSLHLEARLVAQPLPASAVSLLPTYPISASDLRNIQPGAICCNVCDRDLATLPFDNWDVAYKDLPSEHWAEMMEVWMCHNDPSFTATLAQRTKEGFWPKDGGVLVGASYLLIGDERVKWGNVKIADNYQDDLWNVITCQCGETLGKQRVKDDKPGSGTVRFSKWAFSLLKEDDENDHVEFVRFPLSLFIVSDMLELSQAHASHRFIISDEQGNKRIYVWLFNPSVKMTYRKSINSSSPLPSPLRTSTIPHDNNISSRRSSIVPPSTSNTVDCNKGNGKSNLHQSSSNSEHANIKACRVMYKVVDPSAFTDDSCNLPGFGPTGQVENLTYPAIVCDRLIGTLRQSTLIYPLAMRAMGQFDVGFLERV